MKHCSEMAGIRGIPEVGSVISMMVMEQQVPQSRGASNNGRNLRIRASSRGLGDNRLDVTVTFLADFASRRQAHDPTLSCIAFGIQKSTTRTIGAIISHGTNPSALL